MTYRTPYDSEAFITYSADYAANSSESNDVVFLGGSHCFSDVQTRPFEQNTGLSAYNLGLHGMVGTSGYNLILKSYLEHHPAPRIVVFCPVPYELGRPGRANRPEPELQQAYSSAVTERFLWCYDTDGLYSRPSHPDPLRYYIHQGLSMGVGYLCGGETHYLNTPTRELFHLSYCTLKRAVTDNRGSYCFGGLHTLPPAARRPMSPEEALFEEGVTADDPYPVSPAFDVGVRALAQKAADKNILLLIRLAPELQSANVEHFDHIRAWFDRLEADYPNVICDRPEVLLYGPECFWDTGYHCNLRAPRNSPGCWQKK